MKKRLTLLVFPLLLLLALLTACGTQDGNTGPLSDSGQSNAGRSLTTGNSNALPQISLTKLSGGGGCFTREGTGRSDGDYDHNTDYHGQGYREDAPYVIAEFNSCANAISLSIRALPEYSGGTDFYQIRWSRPGLAEQQFKTSARETSLTNAHFETIYSFKIQGCSSHWYGSDCSPWSDPVYVATYAPGECHPGYVWRDAGSGDNVCVTPETRDQAAYDNSQRSNRVDPYGAYGPNSCQQGYVWREAFSGDDVCVTPATRSQTSYDNSQANQRRYP